MQGLTEAQLDILQHLARGEQKQRGRANYNLRIRGLIEFVWNCSDGKLRPKSEVFPYTPDRPFDLVDVEGERITKKGRAALKARMQKESE